MKAHSPRFYADWSFIVVALFHCVVSCYVKRYYDSSRKACDTKYREVHECDSHSYAFSLTQGNHQPASLRAQKLLELDFRGTAVTADNYSWAEVRVSVGVIQLVEEDYGFPLSPMTSLTLFVPSLVLIVKKRQMCRLFWCISSRYSHNKITLSSLASSCLIVHAPDYVNQSATSAWYL